MQKSATGMCRLRKSDDHPTKTSSSTHFNEAIHEEIKVDFTYAMIQAEIQNIICIGTKYVQRAIIQSRSAEKNKTLF